MFEGTGTVIAVIGSVLLLLVILALAIAAGMAMVDAWGGKPKAVKCNRCGEWHAHDPLHEGHPDVHVCVGDKP